MFAYLYGGLTTTFPSLLRPHYWPQQAQKSDVRDASWAVIAVEASPKGPEGGGKRVKLRSRPEGTLEDNDLVLVSDPIPRLAPPGKVVVRVLYLSIDASHREWLAARYDDDDEATSSGSSSLASSLFGGGGGGTDRNGGAHDSSASSSSYASTTLPPARVGDVARASDILLGVLAHERATCFTRECQCPRSGVGQVVSTSDWRRAPVGSYVRAEWCGVQEYAVLPLSQCHPVATGVPLTRTLSVASPTTGLAAWVGVNVCEIKPRDTLVVFGDGHVAGIAGQLAKLREPTCRVIGLARGEHRCAWLRNGCHLDGVIDVERDDVDARLGDLCAGRGVDAYFDDVGASEVLSYVLKRMNVFGRVAYCGSSGGPLSESYSSGSSMYYYAGNSGRDYRRLLDRRVKIQAFVAADHVADLGLCLGELLSYVKTNQLRVKEDVVARPLRDYAAVLRALFEGKHTGKLIMKIADESGGVSAASSSSSSYYSGAFRSSRS